MRAYEFIKQDVTEDIDNLPSVLYHATYKPRLKSIKLKGLGAGGNPNWEDSKPGVVYLALNPSVAESYAETSDSVPEEWLDEIIILKISTAGLDLNKFYIDSNVQDNTGATLEYHGVIPASNISLYDQGVAEDTDFRELLKQPQGDKLITNVPKFLFHATPSKNIDSIKSKGLELRSDNPQDRYEPRIYVAGTVIDALKIANQLRQALKSKQDYTILKINTSGLKNNFYVDPYYSGGAYTDQNISPDSISVELEIPKEAFSTKKNWSQFWNWKVWNKKEPSFIKQGVAEDTIDEGSIPVYKSPSQFYAGAGKTLYKLFRNAFPNLPEHVANDIYNQTSPGTNDTIVNAINKGEDPKNVFLNYYSGITFNFSKDPGTSLTPQQMKTVLLNGRWRQKILTVNPADFAEHSRNRMVKRNFGINPDEDPTRIQRQQSRAKGDGSNEPVIIIQTSNGLILWEGFHRTMSILALGKNGEDPLRWNKVKLRAWVVEIPNQQGVAESTQGVTPTGYTWSFEHGGEVPYKSDVEANTFIRVRDGKGKTVLGVWADVYGEDVEIQYSEVFDKKLRGKGIYTDFLKGLSKHYNIISDQDQNNAARNIYKKLGADYNRKTEKHTLRRSSQGVAEDILQEIFTVPAEKIFLLVKNIHGRKNDFDEGDISDRIYWFDDYKLDRLPISKINLHQWDVDESYVDKLVDNIINKKQKIRPIIFDPIENSIIDGIHRANAYAKLGHKYIPAYIGHTKSNSYGQREDDELDEMALKTYKTMGDFSKLESHKNEMGWHAELTENEDYQIDHRAPMYGSGAPLHDLTNVYPDDIYGPKAIQFYGTREPWDARSIWVIQAFKNKPNKPVQIFRAVPKEVKSNKINPGDWVTVSREYAKQHGRGLGKYKVLTKIVSAKTLFTNGDSIHEWGYDPEASSNVVEGAEQDLESEFNAAYADDPNGVFRNIKDNFLHLISQLKPINHWAVDLNKKINTMSKNDFDRLVMNEIFARLKAVGWPAAWSKEMSDVFDEYKTEKLSRKN